MWSFVNEAFSNKRHAAVRFLALWKGSLEEAYRYLLDIGHGELLMSVLAEKLSSSSSLARYSSIRIWESFLAATDDIDALLDLVSMANDKREIPFDYADFLRQLCMEYITVNPLEKKHLDFIHPESDDLETVDDQFFDAFKMLIGLRKHNTKLYIPKEEIWEAFMAKSPRNAEEFREILEELEAKGKRNLEGLGMIMDTFGEIINSLDFGGDDEEEEEGLSEDLALAQYSIHEQYIIRQALVQQFEFEKPKKKIKKLGKKLRKKLKKKRYASNKCDTPQEYLKHIYYASCEDGLILAKSAWEEIHALKDLKILQLLRVYADMEIHSMTDVRWRKFLFENPQYWSLLLGKE